ncbi:hypothetical protein CEUSTIGMA_g3642.t1 [Chlamydomonas eustigma]|uniref:Uncharacterized protein n=1 Tax=Chlamydomonas eustigma TaxID=1157962 RepID=A0A250WZD0_9CHLO|nr:hypothetical protein CEUSTIGMA_g3642.t1 [Chlamydomonas eustigma]|eukprot:GAX76198.1 hypothetical protein CEUSTIGMA_g3642.t1 [Chlamydomonas eustigma]
MHLEEYADVPAAAENKPSFRTSKVLLNLITRLFPFMRAISNILLSRFIKTFSASTSLFSCYILTGTFRHADIPSSVKLCSSSAVLNSWNWWVLACVWSPFTSTEWSLKITRNV